MDWSRQVRRETSWPREDECGPRARTGGRGPRITTAVLETVTNILDFGMKPADAVAAPRFHHQWLPDALYYERGGLPPSVIEALTARGHKPVEQNPWGAVELIAIGTNGRLTGINDPRRPAGAAIGN